ncbi:hypothetical protein Nepgr_003735 [Nepenthes gracilis]|uniref:Uncharacterized protein n=1 Tax=Nepenthes gracilis TaxID=150966 RepID=A0AAD3S038_NEPGR|nr:hypothetical protein Nepgr_003735 [Nepenthes gracilis]
MGLRSLALGQVASRLEGWRLAQARHLRNGCICQMEQGNREVWTTNCTTHRQRQMPSQSFPSNAFPRSTIGIEALN